MFSTLLPFFTPTSQQLQLLATVTQHVVFTARNTYVCSTGSVARPSVRLSFRPLHVSRVHIPWKTTKTYSSRWFSPWRHRPSTKGTLWNFGVKQAGYEHFGILRPLALHCSLTVKVKLKKFLKKRIRHRSRATRRCNFVPPTPTLISPTPTVMAKTEWEFETPIKAPRVRLSQ